MWRDDDKRDARRRVPPILIADAPLRNLQHVHQPFTPRAVVEVRTGTRVVGFGETYGDSEYFEALERSVEALPGTQVHRCRTDRAACPD